MVTRRDFIKITAAGGALVSAGKTTRAHAAIREYLPDEGLALEKERKIPVFTDTDLVVVGGSSRAVAAAVAAAKTGTKVFLVAEMPYLGDDICGSFFYDVQEEEKLDALLAKKVFVEGKCLPTPLHVKTVLENELINHQVDFLYSSYVSDVLEDGAGQPAGVVIVNRSGRQAIRCKAIIDATHTAVAAQLCGASFQGFIPGNHQFTFSVVGSSPKNTKNIIRTESLSKPFVVNGREFEVARCIFNLPLADTSYPSLMHVEQTIRDQAWSPDQTDSSDLIWYIPSQSLVSRGKKNAAFTSAYPFPEANLQPDNIGNLWVFGPCADIDKGCIAQLMRPNYAMFLGERLGEIVGEKVKNRQSNGPVHVKPRKGNATTYGEVSEVLKPLRPLIHQQVVESPAGALPVIGRYDVVVLGGGTAGAPAGIAAARHGAKTLVLEYLHGLGGLGTLGLIGRYWDGFRGGFSAEVDKGVHDMAPEDHPRQLKDWKDAHLSDWKQEWYRQEIRKAGGVIWYGVMGCGALVEENRVKGIVVTTPFGRGVILSTVLIDSTGSADMAIAAGASYEYTGKNTIAVQGAGLGKMEPGDYYVNNDWAFIDDTDILDISRIYVQAKTKLAGNYDLVKLPQTRERRRVVGDYTVSVYDVINKRRYPDTISYHKSSFDTHGMIVDPYFVLSPPMERHTIYDADVPLRSLLPKGLEGIIVTGLGASAHRDAMPVIRMQSCLQNQGFAVGYLASVCCKESKPIRKVDIKKIQRYYHQVLHQDGEAPEECSADLATLILGNHLSSPAMLVIIPWQDWMAIDDTLKRPDADAERINVPAQTNFFWRYRIHLTIEKLLDADELNKRISELISQHGR
jgi:ribulose 1,5-bisphosphate synthetase/thiazole synthase